MANLRLPLTDAICAQAKGEAREYALRDMRQPGLSLRVQPCGARSWITRTRMNGKAVRHSLGTFPETPVKAARQIAAALIAADAAPPPAPSPSPLFEIFQPEHETRCGAFYKPQGLHTYRGYVRRQLLPAFAGKPLDAITRQDVMRWFERYSAASPGAANRALGILGHILGRAKAWGYMPDGWRNPVTGIRMNRRNVVGTFLSEDQMGRLGALLAVRMTEGCNASALLHFLTLTGCRVSEAINLEWRDVLPDRLRLRDSKTGPRDVPLGLAVRRFFKAHRSSAPNNARTPPSPVFALAERQGYETVRKVWMQIRKQAGLSTTLRIHDLRHSFASHAIMSGETLFLTSRLLGHSRIQMTARYAHLADAALLSNAEKIGEAITRRRGLSSVRA
jgi:integrase